MKNYLNEIYIVAEFKRDNPTLAGQAEKQCSISKVGIQTKTTITVSL